MLSATLGEIWKSTCCSTFLTKTDNMFKKVLLFCIISFATPLLCEAQSDSPCFNSRCDNVTSKCRENPNGGYRCVCFRGFTGDNCSVDLNECTYGRPCGNRGNCLNTIGSYRCTCLRGWTGTHCEHSNSSGTHDCATGWTGTDCTEDVDECQLPDNPCGKGTCTNTGGSYRCQIEDAVVSENKQGLIIGASVGGVVVVGAVAAAVTAYFVFVRNRQKTGIMNDEAGNPTNEEAAEAARNPTNDVAESGSPERGLGALQTENTT